MANIKRITPLPAEQSFFLFGPRGTGKTTWLTEYYTQATPLLLYRRKYCIRKENILCLTTEKFFLNLVPGQIITKMLQENYKNKLK